MSSISYFTPHDLQTFITQNQITARLITNLGDTPTVPAAATALGVASEQIIKTLLFEVVYPGRAAELIVVISNGETRVDKHRLAAHFAVGKKRVNLASAEVVLAQIGYPAGGVPPFGHRTRLPVILDASILRLAERLEGKIYGGGGDDRTMMELTVEELQRVTEALVLEVS